MNELPKVTEIIRWEYRPGDRLIARVNRDIISREEAHAIASRIRMQLHLPIDAPIVIAGGEWVFEVLSGDD